MNNPELTGGEKLASHRQAKNLLIQVGSMAVQKGAKDYHDRYALLVEDVEVPIAVAEYMPQADVDSLSVTNSVKVQWLVDGRTGEPKEAGIVGIVSFAHSEEVEKDVTHETHVTYYIYLRGEDGYTIERLVSYTDGFRDVRKDLAQSADKAVHPLQAWTDRKNSSEMPISAQRMFGRMDVSAHEAAAVIESVSSL